MSVRDKVKVTACAEMFSVGISAIVWVNVRIVAVADICAHAHVYM